MGDNGELKETVNIEDLIIAVRRGKDGQIETLINTANRQELEISLMRLTHQCYGVFNAMSYAKAQENKPKIVQPGGIMNFARRKRA